MSTEPAHRRRAALVLARHSAGTSAPSRVDPAVWGRAALADTYEVLADLSGVASGIVGPTSVQELLWPGALLLADQPLAELAERLTPEVDELVVVPADVPDLPGLVLAKTFKVLHRSDVVVAPARNGPGCVALGLRLPLAPWLVRELLDLDDDLSARLPAAAPGRSSFALAPDWHRLRRPADLTRLDPGLEGWEETRALLPAPGGWGSNGGGQQW